MAAPIELPGLLDQAPGKKTIDWLPPAQDSDTAYTLHRIFNKNHTKITRNSSRANERVVFPDGCKAIVLIRTVSSAKQIDIPKRHEAIRRIIQYYANEVEQGNYFCQPDGTVVFSNCSNQQMRIIVNKAKMEEIANHLEHEFVDDRFSALYFYAGTNIHFIMYLEHNTDPTDSSKIIYIPGAHSFTYEQPRGYEWYTCDTIIRMKMQEVYRHASNVLLTGVRLAPFVNVSQTTCWVITAFMLLIRLFNLEGVWNFFQNNKDVLNRIVDEKRDEGVVDGIEMMRHFMEIVLVLAYDQRAVEAESFMRRFFTLRIWDKSIFSVVTTGYDSWNDACEFASKIMVMMDHSVDDLNKHLPEDTPRCPPPFDSCKYSFHEYSVCHNCGREKTEIKAGFCIDVGVREDFPNKSRAWDFFSTYEHNGCSRPCPNRGCRVQAPGS
jgi:hypothetical protein